MKMRFSPRHIRLLCLLCSSLLPSAVVAQTAITLGPNLNVNDGLITDIQRAPGDSQRLFIVTRAGKIHIIPQGFDGTETSTLFLDINSRVLASGERGLLGLAFDPDYASNSYFYVNYIMSVNGDTKIARFTAINENQADPTSEIERETIAQPYSNHNGGQIQFGPDGFLYVAMGDGGSSGDPQNYAQDPNSLLGKMLRFDASGGGWTAAGSNIAGFNETIWAYGLRNPWRFSFDDSTGDMFIADVGQNAVEEVNFQPSDSVGGENYGWKLCEGLSGYSASSTECIPSSSLPNYVPPIFDYAQSSGNFGRSITGGYVYRGLEYTSTLDGIYFYADYTSRYIFGAKSTASGGGWDGASTSIGTLDRTYITLDAGSQPTTFGQDSTGELYVGFDTGVVSRINAPAASASPTTADTLPPTTTVMPSDEPTKTPTRSPFAVEATCPATYDQTRVITAGLTLHYSIVLDTDVDSTYGGLFCVQLEYEGLGWLGFGLSSCAASDIDNGSCNKMSGGEVVIADPGTTSVKKYKLDGTSGADLVNAQTLIDASMVQTTDDMTIMTYAKLLTEPNEFDILSNGQNLFIFGIGSNNVFPAKHGTRGFFILDRTPCPDPLDQCPGGQLCRPPPCTVCGECNQGDCVSTSGCDWQQGGFICSGGSGCSACGTDATGCVNAGCSWNGKKCVGGSQTASSSECIGTAFPEFTCDPNCGDGVCDAGGGETTCNCEIDCGAPPTETCDNGVDDNCDGLVDCDDPDCAGGASCGECGDGVCDAGGGETTCNCEIDCGAPPTETCSNGVDDNCDGLVDCDDSDCAGDAACVGGCGGDPGDPCQNGSECCSGTCRQKGKKAYTCA